MRVSDRRSGRTWLAFGVRVARPLAVVRPPLDEQCEFESGFLWKMVTERLQASDVKGATAHKAVLEEKHRKERVFFEQNAIPWECQAFRFSHTRKRWVPNARTLDPHRDVEEPMAMPPRFHVPAPVQRAYDAGATEPVANVQINTEANLRTA
jgi:hypothetical protein